MRDLCKFAADVWTIDGPPVRVFGISLPTRMIAIKLADGALWINSPVSLPDDTLEQVRTLGLVKWLVAPTRLHIWRLEEWHTLFPDAELWMPPQVPKKFRCLPYAGILGDVPPRIWADDLDQVAFRGSPFWDEIFFLHKKSGTVIAGDLIQNHPTTKGRPFFNALATLAGVAAPNGGVPRDAKLLLSLTNRRLARRSLDKLMSWDFDKLIIAHGICIETEAKPFVERAFRWLAR